MVNSVGVLVISSREYGGGERSARLLVREIAARGVRVKLVCYPPMALGLEFAPRVSLLKGPGPAVLRGQPLAMLVQSYLALKRLEVTGAKIVHVYNVFPAAAAGLYKLLGGKCKVVSTLNSFVGVCPTGGYICLGKCSCSPWRSSACLISNLGLLWAPAAVPYAGAYPVLTKLMKLLDGYIALSEAVKRIYVHHGYPEERMRVIPNFCEDLPEERARASKRDDRFTILYVGTLGRHKGVDVLIRAFGKLVSQRPHSSLLVVGGGPQEGELRNLAARIGVSSKVCFTGRVPPSAVWDYYRRADIFVHPGIWPEPFGRTILEAMTVGLPCVVSDIGAPPEIVGPAGMVFPPGDDAALAEILVGLHDDPLRRERMSEACRSVVARYRPEVVVPQIIEYYAELLHGPA